MKIYISIPSWKNKKSLDELRKRADVVVAEKRPTQSEFEEISKNFDGLIVGRLHDINKEILNNPNLKFIGLLAKGSDNIDKLLCQEKNIPVFYTPEANISSVAEHVLALMLSLSKNIVNLDKSVREKRFDELRLNTIEIKNKTLGVIGAGPIAKEAIKRAKAFEMNIICYTPNPDKHQDLNVEFVSLENLLQQSDFVSVNIPLKKETTNFIDFKELSLMKPSSYIINTSRGGVVNENALIKILKDKKIAGAGIDVFEEEPTKNKDLFKLDNVILTPHVAGVSIEALNRMEEHLITDIISFLDGENIKYKLV
jgi:phosphoglycerate dehydrogenase-like enzyme